MDGQDGSLASVGARFSVPLHAIPLVVRVGGPSPQRGDGRNMLRPYGLAHICRSQSPTA